MNSKSRVVNSTRNIVVTVVCQLTTLLFSFVTRTFFIRWLGSEYLGLNGLFSSILSVLSMADLGFGAAISFALYKPIAGNDTEKIKSLVQYFKKIYRVIAVIVAILGAGCIPFLKYIVNSSVSINAVLYVYALQLANTVVSYLCVYKSTLLMADQRVYITKIINSVFLLIANVVQIAVLFVFRSYAGYLIVQLCATVGSNVAITIISDRVYPFLKEPAAPVDNTLKNDIISGVKSLFIYRIAGITLTTTDNILISMLISTSVVGVYSNYTLISGSLAGIVALVFDAVMGSIGSLTAQENINNSKKNFETIQLMCFWIYALISICLFLLLDDFIRIWIGEKYVLGKIVCLMIVLSIYIPGIMKVVAAFRDTTGLYAETKYVFVVASAINLVLSVVLGKVIGLVGILAATSISRLLTSVPYEPYILYKLYFKQQVRSYYISQVKYLVILIVSASIAYLFSWFFTVDSALIFIVKASVIFVVTNICFLIAFRKNPEYKDILSKIKFVLQSHNM